MKRLIGCMAVLCLLALTVGCGGVTSNGTLAYVSNSGGTGFTVFQVNTNGTLTTSVISPQSTPVAPLVLQFSPNGKWAYFLDNTAKVTIPNTSFSYNTGTTLYVYARAGNGTLATFIGSYALNNGASSLAVSANSTYVYVAQPNAAISGGKTGELQVFSIDQQTGLLTGSTPVDVGYSITQLVMNSTGSLLFGLSPSQQTVVSWTLNATTGAATQAATLSVGTLPDYMILSANGSYMYIPDFLAVTPDYPNAAAGGAPGNSPDFYVYSVASSGVLSPILGQSTSPVFNENADLLTGDFPLNPVGGSTSSDSRYLFLLNQGGAQGSSISVFKIAASGNTGIPGEPTEVLGDLVTVNGISTSTASPFPCGCSGASFAAVPKVYNALYVLSESANLLYQFSVNENSGVLRALTPPSVPLPGTGTLSAPTWITIH
jgi:hypothetical protein